MSFPHLLQSDPALQAFILDQTKSPQEFNSIISDQDEMYLFALQNHRIPEKAAIRYYFNGRRIFDAVQQIIAWHFQDFNQVESFLDFASGYGRFTRFLIQELPVERVWISDIYPDAVTFQMEQFGVHGICSTAVPANYSVDKKFDCIFACSFFSHLPEQTFTAWMHTLYHLIKPEGILIFSVHDRELLPPHLSIQSSEILFAPQSESRSLDVNEYGTSYVGEEFVRQVIHQVSQGEAACERIPKGICRYQDLYIVTQHPVQNFSTLQFSHHPLGRIEQLKMTSDGLEIQGWVSEINPGSQVEEISVFLNGNKVQKCLPVAKSLNQDDQLSWSCQVNLSTLSPQDILLIKAVNTRGLEWVFEAATLKTLTPENWQ